MALSSVQRRVERKCKYCRAVRIILGALTPGERAYLDESLASIPTLTKTPLLGLERYLEADLSGLDAMVGLAEPPETYISLVEDGAKQYPDQMMFVHKHYLDRLFTTRQATLPRWKRHPPHSMFGIDCAGRFPMPPGHIEFRLMEATLFEDLAMLWNECLAHEVPEPEQAAVHDARIPIKRFNVLKRSTARAVFALLEGYINGVAVDTRYTSQQGEFTQEQQDMLLERRQDGRPNYLSLRDKLLQYPKLALRAQHPPLQATSPDFALVLLRERQLRDAVVHPSPRFDEGRPVSREESYYELRSDELGALVDASIRLIRSVDAALAGRFGSVEIWLANRQADGRFASEVFH